MADTTKTPDATGTPSGATPAASANGAGNTTSTEPGSLDDLLMAELEGESGTDGNAGDGDTTRNDDDAGTDDSDDSQQNDGDEESPEGGEETEEEDGDGETEEDDDEDDSEETETPANTEGTGAPKGVQAALKKAGVAHGILTRINNAFTKNAEHRARIGELETQLAERGDPVMLAPTPKHPLSDVRTEAELRDREEGAQWWLDWCHDNPEGGTVGKGDKAREFTAEDVKAQRKWARDVLREAPKRQTWIAERTKAEAVARKAFPEMFRKGSPEFTAAKHLTEGTPELVHQSDYHIVMADMVRGLKTRVLESQGYKIVIVPPEKKGGKKGEAATPPKGGNGQAPVSPQNPRRPAPTPATPPTRPPARPAGGKANQAAAAARAAETGDVGAMLDAELMG